MDQEKFINVYIELLNSTLVEALQKNIVAQAKNKIFEGDYNELKASFDSALQEKEDHILKLVGELNAVRKQIGQLSTEVENNRTASEHFETYKNELLNCRSKNEELLNLIKQKDALIAQKDKQLAKFNAGPKPVVINKLNKKTTPVETKKVEQEETPAPKTTIVKTVKDAGNF